MRTVQELINEVDWDDLESNFFFLYGPKFYELTNVTMNFKEVRHLMHEIFTKYINRLATMNIHKSEKGEEYVFVATKCCREGTTVTAANAYTVDELLQDGAKASPRDCIFVPQEVTLGYKVYESALFRQEKYQVLAGILGDMSFLGYEQEHLEEEEQRIKEALEESEKGECKSVSIEDLDIFFYESMGRPVPLKYEREKELRQNISHAEVEYDMYCRTIELEKLVQELRGGGGEAKMTKYEFAFKQEILMEIGAGILGDIFRYESDHNISDSDNPISRMYSLVWRAKQDILFAKTEAELFRIEGKFELARALIIE